jgi:ureidoacrylate peracid hydrolase
VRGSPGGALHAALDVRPDDPLFTKTHPSAFQETGLQSFLQRAGIRALDVSGFETQMCCDTTLRDAYGRGYRLRLFKDACAAGHLVVDGETVPHDVVHRVSLGVLSRFATVLTTDEAE